jgi:hypothetical protein
MKYIFFACLLLLSLSSSGKESMKITEEIVDSAQVQNLTDFARDVRLALNPETKDSSSESLLIWADSIAYDWQNGKVPAAKGVETEEFLNAVAITWAEQIVKRHKWLWVKLVFHDYDNWKTLAVVSPDRSMIILPFASLHESIKGDSEVLIAASMNAIGSKVIPKFEPQSYTNIMHGLHRILPR